MLAAISLDLWNGSHFLLVFGGIAVVVVALVAAWGEVKIRG